ncbi:MAG: sulfatase-like hydrolase/transferase, partial [Patescibacteria group bacterium]|nr:sulfatase-like hydrolase/transferase [Patescibacteria group bacterium]
MRTRFIFDWPFFWLNRSEAFITLFKIFPSHSWFSFLFLACLVFLVLFGILKTILFDLKFKPKRIYFISLAVLFFSGFIILSLSPLDVNGFLAGFIKKNFFSDNKIENFYTGEYNNHIINCQLGGGLDPAGLQLDNLGDKIFFIHLESVSSFLVNERNTPNLFRYSKQGVFFPSFYSSSVQTIRNEESILCGLPPALKENLISGLSWGKIDSLSCLPRILEQLGYKTLFFKDDSLNFAHTGDFMSGIGFEEIHHEDIMHKNDPELPWGFREDIFFDRVLEYIKSHYANEKIFAYIALSATNHTPFEINDDRYKTLVPYPASENPKQKLANTTFIQDAYVGDFLDDLFLNYPENSSFFVFSDQAWPIGIHPNNIYNEQGFYDENFLTFLLFLPPKNRNDIYEFDKVVDARYSQMDILPTIFEILGANNSYFLGNSFAGDIFKADVLPKPDEENSILMIQPYAGGFLAFVDWPEKYVFSI